MLCVTETTHVEAECVDGASFACGIKHVAPINLMLNEALEAFISVLEKHTLADLGPCAAARGVSSQGEAPIKIARDRCSKLLAPSIPPTFRLGGQKNLGTPTQQ